MRPVADPLTIARQRRASDPAASAWVSANAGSGKTKVLVDRVLRLMLAGSRPSRILCLTFTRAAAANMAVRVFGVLGQWVTMPEPELRDALEALEGSASSARKLVAARRLFAEAVETPGGLKIETIHAFCERILHIAPFEANVPASFSVLDETDAAILAEEAQRSVLATAAAGPLAAALEAVADDAADVTLPSLVAQAMQFRPLLRRAAADPAFLDAAMAQAARALGIAEGETREAVEAAILGDSPILAHRDAWIADLSASARSPDQKLAAALADLSGDPAVAAAAYRRIFLTTDNAPRAAVGSKAHPLAGTLREEAERVADLVRTLAAHDCLRRTDGLLRLACAVFKRIEAMKRARAMLDFQDLLERTAALMRRPAAAWVLEKLDSGIDHLLVDEAQDTNPLQWDILRAVTAEFHAGEGTRGAGSPPRTIFAVGDPKQSIFGFQGAEPRLFEETGRALARAVSQAGGTFHREDLIVSFRSAPAVLAAVDRVFSDPAHFDGLSFAAGIDRTIHESARPQAAGSVEVWPVLRPPDKPDADAWQVPLDEVDASEPPAANARRIAQTVRRWIARDGIAPGEILILARKRGAAFLATIRALKQAGVPVAGADRLVLSEHIAVMDLIAAGRAALLPGDDLTLATVLKSPLLGWNEDDLMALAAGRPDLEALERTLDKAAANGDLRAGAACDALARWRSLAARHGPFSFYATLLGPQGGRDALVARLGPEAADAIDTFLARAFAFERARTPSLSGFLDEIAGSELSVKRELEAETREVRVMTVHGSKGLESSAVILIDGCETSRPPRPSPLHALDIGIGVPLPVWAGKAQDDPAPVAAARAATLAEAAREHNRLLYVAMTRAKDRLAVAPHIGSRPKDPPPLCWSEMVRRSLAADGSDHEDAELGGTVVALRSGTPLPPPGPAAEADEEPRPAWLDASVPADAEPLPPLRPSAAGAADRAARQEALAAASPFDAGARLVGTVVHALLQYLPDLEPARRPKAARAYADMRLGRIGPDIRAGIVRDALAILDDPLLAPLFGPGSRPEVPLAGAIALGGAEVQVSGQLDRLAILPHRIVFCDFKTSARPPATADVLPESHVSQVAVYAALLERAFPGRPVEALLVYTAGGRVFSVAAGRMAAALAALAPP